MNPARRILFLFALAAAVGSLVGLVIKFFIFPHWRVILLIAYFACGLFGLATNIYISRKQQTESDKVKRKVLQKLHRGKSTVLYPRSLAPHRRHNCWNAGGSYSVADRYLQCQPNLKLLMRQAASGGDWPSFRLLGLESELQRKEYVSSFFTFLVIGATFCLGFAGITVHGAWLIFFTFAR